MSDYITKIGKLRQGQSVNGDPNEALQYKHDLLRLAVDYHMDVYMLCGSLGSLLREDRYRKVVGHSFADSLREVLQAKQNVSALLWSDQTGASLAPSLIDLIAEAANRRDWGVLDVRISGTTSGEDAITHFAVAKSRDDREWAVRVERPHKPFTAEEWNTAAQVPAAIMFRTPDAEKTGKQLLEMFQELFNAVPDREYEIAPSVPRGSESLVTK